MAGVVAWRTRRGASYEVTVALRVTEPSVQSSGIELGMGMLRAHLNQLAFSNARLLALMGRHPKLFGDVTRDPTSALDDLRGQLDVFITDSDFIEERLPGDPPRSARVEITYRGATPEVTWSVAHELAELAISSTLEREQAALEGAATATSAALHHARGEDDAPAPEGEAVPAGPRPAIVAEQLRAASSQVTAADLARRAAEGQQALQFEIVDPGRVPAPMTRGMRVVAGLAALLVALAISALLAGAFDPRVLDTVDLRALAVPSLGHLPPLPAAQPLGPGAPTSPPAPAPEPVSPA
jgi:hypothetical protein